MIIDERYKNGIYKCPKDSQTSIKEILYRISDEFNYLGTLEDQPQSKTQNELLIQMRNVAKQLQNPKKTINIIDETLIIQEKQTQDYYKQLIVKDTNQKKIPKRIVRGQMKKLPPANIDLSKAENFYKSQLIVKNFRKWKKMPNQIKALKLFDIIILFQWKKQTFNQWKKTLDIEITQYDRFNKILDEKKIFRSLLQRSRVFFAMKQSYIQSRLLIRMYFQRKYFNRLKSISKQNTQSIKFRYFSQLKHKNNFSKICKNINRIIQNQKLRQIFVKLREYNNKHDDQKLNYLQNEKEIPNAKINQFKADNFRKSQLIVQNFLKWTRNTRQQKALKLFGVILPLQWKKLTFNLWKNSAEIDKRKYDIFTKIQVEKKKFRVFLSMKQSYIQTKYIRLYRLRKYFKELKSIAKLNTQTINKFRYFLRLKLSFRKLLVNTKLTQVKKKFSNIFKNINLQKQNQKLRSIFIKLCDYSRQRVEKKRFIAKVSQIFFKRQKIQIFSTLNKYAQNKQRQITLTNKAQIISQNNDQTIQYLYFDCWKKATAHKQIQKQLKMKADQIFILKMKQRVFRNLRKQDRRVHFKEEYEQNWNQYRQIKWNDV